MRSLVMFDAFLSDVHEGTTPTPTEEPEPQKSVA
jgi:hypothetical protein